jgi:zinc transport system ATP-binding protein
LSDVPVFKFENVSFSYGSSPVLEDVNLQIDAGEFTSIVGPNGGGKTTLLKLMLGLLKPDRGKVSVYGKPPSQARKRIGYLPQFLQFDPAFPVTMLDVVLMGRLGGYSIGPYTKNDKLIAMKVLERVGISELSKRPFSSLSGGQRQRALIARTLACEPDTLLLDEPTANIAPDVETMLFDFLSALKDSMTVLLVSHDLGFVSKSVKSVICVNQRVVRHPTSEITQEAVQDLYQTEMRIVRHDKLFKSGE